MKIQVLCGMISSGKSSYCRQMGQQGFIVVNDYTLYDKGLKILYKSIENHIIQSALSFSKNVIADRGLNISVEGRKRYVAIAKSFDVECEAIIFKNYGPEIHAQRRFNSDARGYSKEYWLKVALAHNLIFNIPSLQEGFDYIKYASYKEGIVSIES